MRTKRQVLAAETNGNKSKQSPKSSTEKYRVRAHNPEVAGSSPAAATKSGCFRKKTATFFAFLLENDLGQRLGQVLTQTLTQTARGAFRIRR